MEKSSLRIISNIALKRDYEKNPKAYLPYDLLPREDRDARLTHRLTEYQQKQQIKKLFWTENVIDKED